MIGRTFVAASFPLGRMNESSLAELRHAIEGGRSIPFSNLLTLSSAEWGAPGQPDDADDAPASSRVR